MLKRFGPNTALVQEVIDTMTGDRFIANLVDGQNPPTTANEQFVFIGDIAKSITLSMDQNVYLDGYTDWNDVRELAIGKLFYPKNPVIPDYQEVRSMIAERGANLNDEIMERIGPKAQEIVEPESPMAFWHVVKEYALTDFEAIALARLQFGVGYEPFETMFEAYKLGGWPCGWKGEYPEGKMVVYHAGANA